MFSNSEAETVRWVKMLVETRLQEIQKQPWFEPHLPWNNVYLSGGAIASLIHGEEPKDWDFYFETMEAMNMFYDHLQNNKEYIQAENPNYHTGNAVTMQDKSSFIIMMAADPGTVKKTFDYAHTTAHYSLRNKTLYISHKTFTCARNKILSINNPDMVKEWRKQKFISRGYKLE